MLWLCGILHVFTHIYHVALLPLYLLVQQDLNLASVEQATLLVTVLMLSYYLPSYPLGVLADSLNRKKLLAVGLIINGLGFVALSYAQSYALALTCVILAGIGGSFYHPAATAWVARLYPVGTGKALGLVGIGASVGFFLSPVYTGWRAEVTGNWRTPVFELGWAGVVCAFVFLWLAQEEPSAKAKPRPAVMPGKIFPTPALWLSFLAASLALSMRDFAGSSMGSLGSLFLQQAHGYNIKDTGLALSGIFLASSISNPLFGRLSDGGRSRWCFVVLTLAAVMVAMVPRVPTSAVVPVFATYGFFFMASFPIVEAALMESVPDNVRGRVFGLFITVGGLVGNLAHWLVGNWVKALGPVASSPTSYYWMYAILAGLLLLSTVGLLFLHAIRKREAALAHETPAEASPGAEAA